MLLHGNKIFSHNNRIVIFQISSHIWYIKYPIDCFCSISRKNKPWSQSKLKFSFFLNMIWCYRPFKIRKAHAREQNMPFLFMSVTKIRRKDYCFQIRKKAVVGPPCLVHNRFNHCIRSKFETNLFTKFIVGHKNTKIAWWQHAANTPCNEYHQKHMTTRFGLRRRIFFYVLV